MGLTGDFVEDGQELEGRVLDGVPVRESDGECGRLQMDAQQPIVRLLRSVWRRHVKSRHAVEQQLQKLEQQRLGIGGSCCCSTCGGGLALNRGGGRQEWAEGDAAAGYAVQSQVVGWRIVHLDNQPVRHQH